MAELIFLLICITVLFWLAINQAPVWMWAAAAVFVTLALMTGLVSGTYEGLSFSLSALLSWVPAFFLVALSFETFRLKYVIKPLFKAVKSILPKVSPTEQEALDAGTVGWDAQLFSGSPDWSKLKSVPPVTLTEEEKQFLAGPTADLCKMLDDWDLRHTCHDIPPKIWKFVRDNGFLGMLISKEHGGLGFSPQAQSMVLEKISSRSPDVCTIVMVPNSLGPGELIEKYGTSEQKDYYLPRLAQGKEIPCFALTGPTSGSDAANMRDIGVVCKGTHKDKEIVGIKLNWEKRYISLGPDATILGLAFRLFDPDNLLGRGEDVGITLALIPTDHKGVEIGDRHLPCGSAFPNGPNWGRDVFIPMDWVIGGEERVGQGWRMLMSCLSAGRSISLPASSTAAAKSMLRATTAYARIRKQFGISIGRMEGIEEALTRIVEHTYVLESARAVTASMVSSGEKPAVISALLKYQSTERMRQCVNDAMDIHGGKAICDGPSNYLQAAYQMVPVGITVEGANILTRTLITFAQGALRSHPWLYEEIQAVQNPDQAEGLIDFDRALCGHVSYTVSNIFGALFHNITAGLFASAPAHAHDTAQWYNQLHRGNRTFALVSDITIALLGGGLKVKQKITGRLADALSELYLLSCILKRYEDDGEPLKDAKIMEYCARNCLYRFQEAIRGVIDNFPVSWAGWLLIPLVFPLGARFRPASDRLGKMIVRQAMEPGEVRDRLTRDIYVSHDKDDITGLLEVTLAKVNESEAAEKKLEKAIRSGLVRRYHGYDWIEEAAEKDIITSSEARLLRETEELVSKVIAVDHFDGEALVPHYKLPKMNDIETIAAAE